MKVKLLILLLVPFLSISQILESVPDSNKIYDVVGVAPSYPGGEEAMAAFINENFKYPQKSREMGEQGTCYVRFVVTKLGDIDSVEVLKGVSELIDAECISVIESMPRWNPGEHDGNPVDVWYTIPIRCRLYDDVEEKKKKKWFKRR